MYLNKATILGNITRDIELKALANGIKVASFSVATNRVWKGKTGARQETSDYHNIVIFGKQAETISQYMKKGSQVLIEGRLQTRSWENTTTNTKNYRTEIIADRVQFGNTKKDDKPSTKEEELDTVEYPDEQISLEEIPF